MNQMVISLYDFLKCIPHLLDDTVRVLVSAAITEEVIVDSLRILTQLLHLFPASHDEADFVDTAEIGVIANFFDVVQENLNNILVGFPSRNLSRLTEEILDAIFCHGNVAADLKTELPQKASDILINPLFFLHRIDGHIFIFRHL